MSADLLREAARLMRERAGAATDGPWVHEGASYQVPSHNVRAQHQQGWPLQGVTYGVARVADAAHIASWHPVVALAVAGWLDIEADQADDDHPRSQISVGALRVARAYLGRAA